MAPSSCHEQPPVKQQPLRHVTHALLPGAESKLQLDFASLLGPLFFTWLAQLILPVMLVALVYEKQQGCAPRSRLLRSSVVRSTKP